MPEEVNFEEILIAPLEAIVRKVAASIAEAQRRLDEVALETHVKLKEIHPELADVGYVPTWYHMPEVNVELKMVMHYEEKGEGREREKPRLLWAPFNAKYKSTLAFEAEGTSNIKLKIVSMPPPAALTVSKSAEE